MDVTVKVCVVLRFVNVSEAGLALRTVSRALAVVLLDVVPAFGRVCEDGCAPDGRDDVPPLQAPNSSAATAAATSEISRVFFCILFSKSEWHTIMAPLRSALMTRRR